jgi:hypothetical protein
MLGGENQQNRLNRTTGYSKPAQPSYLEPNSQSLQKNRRRGRSLLTVFSTNTMLKTRTYLEPISSSLQKPIEGLPAQPPQPIYSINKGAIAKTHNRTKTSSNLNEALSLLNAIDYPLTVQKVKKAFEH